MSIFHRDRIQFQKPDPLDDGTAEEIASEEQEAAINLYDNDGQNIVDFWDNVSKSLKKDSKS